ALPFVACRVYGELTFELAPALLKNRPSHALSGQAPVLAHAIPIATSRAAALRKGLSVITRRVFSDREMSSSMWAPAFAASCLMLLVGTPLHAQDAPLPPITVGAG